MPRIKRWFHVSHDLNADPEVWELTDLFGDRALRVWLEILSIAERNDGEIPGWSAELSPQLRRSLAGRCRTSGETVGKVARFSVERSWVVSGTIHRTRNHAKYNPSRDANRIPDGSQTMFPPTSPAFLPERNPLNPLFSHTEPHNGGAPPARLPFPPKHPPPKKRAWLPRIECPECHHLCLGEPAFDAHFEQLHAHGPQKPPA